MGFSLGRDCGSGRAERRRGALPAVMAMAMGAFFDLEGLCRMRSHVLRDSFWASIHTRHYYTVPLSISTRPLLPFRAIATLPIPNL